jgi:hypothetical protein
MATAHDPVIPSIKPPMTGTPDIAAEKPKRRRLTPEQRVAEREAEIQRIKAKQRDEMNAAIAKAANDLRAIGIRAVKLDADTGQRCADARAVLLGEAQIEAEASS